MPIRTFFSSGTVVRQLDESSESSESSESPYARYDIIPMRSGKAERLRVPFYIPETRLSSDSGKLVNVPIYMNSRGQHVQPSEQSEEDKVGMILSSTWSDEHKAPITTIALEDTPRGDIVKRKFDFALAHDNPNYTEFSAVLDNDEEIQRIDGEDSIVVTNINRVLSVDIVNRGAYDTEVIRELSEDLENTLTSNTEDNMPDKTTETTENTDDSQVTQLQSDLDTRTTELSETTTQLSETRSREAAATRRIYESEVADLPDNIKDTLRERLHIDDDENIVSLSQLDAELQFVRQAMGDEESNEDNNDDNNDDNNEDNNDDTTNVRVLSVNPSKFNMDLYASENTVMLSSTSDPGNTTSLRETQVDVREKRMEAVLRLLSCHSGIDSKGELSSINDKAMAERCFNDVVRAFSVDTSDTEWKENLFNEIATPPRMLDQTTSTGFGQILNDAITLTAGLISRRSEYIGMVQALAGSSGIMTVPDFRTYKIPRWSQYGIAPEVAEQGTVQEITTPSNTVGTVKARKFEVFETVSLEEFVNNPADVISRLPLLLGEVPHRTVLHRVVDFMTDIDDAMFRFGTTEDSAEINLYMNSGDSNPPFVNELVGNVAATGLSYDNIIKVMGLMLAQTPPGNSNDLGRYRPARLVVEADQELVARAIVEAIFKPGDSNNEPNLASGLRLIVLDRAAHLAAKNPWFLLADPAVSRGLVVAYRAATAAGIFVRDFGDNVFEKNEFRFKTGIHADITWDDPKAVYVSRLT